MQCIYCNNILSSCITLKFHQKNTLYCIRIQQEKNLEKKIDHSIYILENKPALNNKITYFDFLKVSDYLIVLVSIILFNYFKEK